jgi:hypothetical protein
MVEFVLYVILLAPKYKKDPLFWLIPAVLIMLPNFTIGEGRDLEMKASIPALFLLMYYVGRYFFKDNMFRDNRDLLRNCLLVALLAIGCMTPLIEQTRAVKAMWEQKKLNVTADDIPTLASFGEGQNNFVSRTYRDSAFFKYLVKDADKADVLVFLEETEPDTFDNCDLMFESAKEKKVEGEIEIWMNYETGGYYSCTSGDDLIKARFKEQFPTMEAAYDYLCDESECIIIYRDYYNRLIDQATVNGNADQFLNTFSVPDQNAQWILMLRRTD